MDDQTTRYAEQLVTFTRQFEGCIVAYSGGVDSAVVAKAAHVALGDRAIAVTGISTSLAHGELETARRVAGKIGIRHQTVTTGELERAEYLENAPDRCFHCKTELYEQLGRVAEQIGVRTILNGANLDDQSDFRPGMRAAANFHVRSPLAECGLGKPAVRSVARGWDIEIWDKPATPCLSSRVAYGVNITPERLARIDAAEQMLRVLGLSRVRVRLHENELARIEAALSDLPQLCEPGIRETLVDCLRQLGFKYVTVDLEGFRSGSFQQLIPASELKRFAQHSADSPQ